VCLRLRSVTPPPARDTGQGNGPHGTRGEPRCAVAVTTLAVAVTVAHRCATNTADTANGAGVGQEEWVYTSQEERWMKKVPIASSQRDEHNHSCVSTSDAAERASKSAFGTGNQHLLACLSSLTEEAQAKVRVSPLGIVLDKEMGTLLHFRS
jgi:hypothetical protein